jgi:hypothetical protein
MMRWACSAQSGKKYIRYLVCKPEGKRPLGRPRHRRKDNIETRIEEIGREGVDWINLDYDCAEWRAILNTVMKLLFP